MQENPDLDALPEEVRGLVLDREQMVAALQASKEQHLAFIDVAEDGIAMRETRQTPDLVGHRKLFAIIFPSSNQPWRCTMASRRQLECDD